MPNTTNSPLPGEQHDFSLVLGGPLFQLFQRAHLSGNALELVRRRILVIAGLAWVPLLLLSVSAGHAWGSSLGIPFLYDVEQQVRFLVAIPILISAELIVHQRLLPVVRQFVERRIVVPEDLPRFQQAITSTLRLRNSVILEVALLVTVFALGPWVWMSRFAQEGATWYGRADGALTPAGYWLLFVSLPIFQFIWLRWYLRILLWFSFLWRVSRLNLRLVPIHPDRAGGLGFLGATTYAFSPLLLAQGALLSGVIATRIFHAGEELMSFKVQIAGLVIAFLVFILSPLAVFSPHLARARRSGLGSFGLLASRYVRAFEEKWLRDGAASDGELLGSGDVQSLADLGTSFSVVQEMRLAPFGWKDVTTLAGAVLLPLLPLVLTVFSLTELVDSLINVLL